MTTFQTLQAKVSRELADNELCAMLTKTTVGELLQAIRGLEMENERLRGTAQLHEGAGKARAGIALIQSIGEEVENTNKDAP